MYTIKITMRTFFDMWSNLLRKNKFFEVDVALNADGFKIPTEVSYELDASPKHK